MMRIAISGARELLSDSGDVPVGARLIVLWPHGHTEARLLEVADSGVQVPRVEMDLRDDAASVAKRVLAFTEDLELTTLTIDLQEIAGLVEHFGDGDCLDHHRVA